MVYEQKAIYYYNIFGTNSPVLTSILLSDGKEADDEIEKIYLVSKDSPTVMKDLRETLPHFWRDRATVEVLDGPDCTAQYAQARSSNRGDVLAVMNVSNTNVDMVWAIGNVHNLNVSAVDPEKWPCGQVRCPDKPLNIYDFSIPARNWTTASVEYCFSQRMEERCRLRMSAPILIVVITTNAIKAICMLGTLLDRRKVLLTLGDFIESFLTNPDPIIQPFRTMRRQEYRGHLGYGSHVSSQWQNKAVYRSLAVSLRQWRFCTAW